MARSLWCLFALLLPSQAQWTGWGANIFNNRWAIDSAVSKSNVKEIIQHCQVNFTQGVSAAPAIDGTIAYFPAWDGSFTAYDYVRCEVVWKINVTALVYEYAPPNVYAAAVVFPGSRTSPQIDTRECVLYFGTQLNALLVAVDLRSGHVLGLTQVHPHPLAIVTMSPTLYAGKVFLGTASGEESAAAIPSYPCCSFVGNFAAFNFDRTTGQFDVCWNVTMLPPPYGPGEWSGAAIWGSQPSIDVERQQVFIATGNVYDIPIKVQACINGTGNNNETACYPSTVYQESVIAFDIESGKINWIQRLSALDAWTLACGLGGLDGEVHQPTCPPSPGIDADFGMAPTFVSGSFADTPSHADVVVVSQKNANLYAIVAASGKVYWVTVTSVDSGATGALSWGVAVDTSRVYFTAYDAASISWKLEPSGRNISNSAYGAVALENGTILWETQAPNNSISFAPPTVTNDVVFVGLGEPIGAMLIFDKVTGNIISRISTGPITYGGVAVQGNFVMFGTGYNRYNGTGSFNVYSVEDHHHGWY